MDSDGPRVLLVEDSPDLAKLLEAIFHARSLAQLHHVPSLAAARQALADPCDAVVLDLNLPDSRGLDTLRAMRKLAPHAAVVVLTAEEDRSTGLEALALGADAYLAKQEAGLRMLPREVEHALERRRLQAEILATRMSRPLARAILHQVLARSDLAPPQLTQMGEELAALAPGATVQGLADAYVRAGMGASMTIEQTQPDRYVATAHETLEQRADGRSASCFLTLGFLRGGISRAHAGRPAPGTEIECQSLGDPRCKFVIQVRP